MSTPDARRDVQRGPTQIGRIMSRLMARSGYGREQAAGALLDAWRRAVPVQLAAGSRPGGVRRGVLEVLVTHSAIAQELGFHKRDIVARLGEYAPAAGVTDIRCRLSAAVADG